MLLKNEFIYFCTWLKFIKSSMLLSKLFSKASGLAKLAEYYKIDPLPAKVCIPNQTLRIGQVRYRRCVRVNSSEIGFYFLVKLPFSKAQPIMIPWKDFRQSGTTKVYWETAIKFVVGKPFIAEIAVPMPLYRMMVRYFNEDRENN